MSMYDIYIYIYTHICMCIHIYIYIYEAAMSGHMRSSPME